MIEADAIVQQPARNIGGEPIRGIAKKVAQLKNGAASQLDFVCTLFDIKPEDLVKITQERAVVRPRQVLMSLLYGLPTKGGQTRSFPAVARLFVGGKAGHVKDHATVISARKKVLAIMSGEETCPVLTPKRSEAVATFAVACALYGCLSGAAKIPKQRMITDLESHPLVAQFAAIKAICGCMVRPSTSISRKKMRRRRTPTQR